MMIKCEICNNLIYKNIFRKHIKEHNITELDYWRRYIVKDKNAGNCLVCGKLLNMNRFHLFRGFNVKVHSGKCNSITLDNYRKIYGNELGEEKYKHYVELQSKTNTFEYKSKKYGMTKEEFDKFNKSRSITEENLIKKYGEELGKQKFNEYIEKQRYNGCKLEYFIEKYGLVKGKDKYNELNHKKGLTLDNFIRKYGSEEGFIKYNEYIKRSHIFYSNISNEFFKKLILNLPDNKYYYGENEFGLWNRYTDSYSKYDFVDLTNKKIIEFNGEKFHPHTENDINFKNPYNNITSQEQWKIDRTKEQLAIDNGFKIMYIWEKDVNYNYINELNKCINFIKEN